jgi:hypothetical protein
VGIEPTRDGTHLPKGFEVLYEGYTYVNESRISREYCSAIWCNKTVYEAGMPGQIIDLEKKKLSELAKSILDIKIII